MLLLVGVLLFLWLLHFSNGSVGADRLGVELVYVVHKVEWFHVAGFSLWWSLVDHWTEILFHSNWSLWLLYRTVPQIQIYKLLLLSQTQILWLGYFYLRSICIIFLLISNILSESYFFSLHSKLGCWFGTWISLVCSFF